MDSNANPFSTLKNQEGQMTAKVALKEQIEQTLSSKTNSKTKNKIEQTFKA